ncbi:MAG TPA: O-antigen ligase family protein [Sedimentisphaerales bacterium]|nr:O-antigen ligase family protein [Sedimentisphaerales bacterium]
MMEYSTSLDNSSGASSKFDVVIECLLVGLLAFMPLALGVVHAWSEEVVIAISGAMVVCFLLKLLLNGQMRRIKTWAYFPIAAFVLIAALQLVPLPARVVGIISPNTVKLKTELLGGLVGEGAAVEPMTLSFYTNATIHDLRLALAVAAVFVVVLNVFRRPSQIVRLLTAIAVIGGAVAAIALAQDLFGNGRIYWLISSKHRIGHAGPFVNHSNYGQFMNLSIGAALGLLIVKLHQGFAGKEITPRVIVKYLGSRSARLIWLLVAIMAVGAATVFISLTRGGMISVFVAMVFTTLLLAMQRSLRKCVWGVIVAAFITLLCVLHVRFDAIYDSLASLRNFDGVDAGRLQILKDIGQIWTKFPVWGTGLGTHSVVYPMFDRSTIPQLAAHAENEYAQVLEETGLAGLGVLMVFAVIIWSVYAKNIRGARLSIRTASYGLGFGLLAVLIHSFSDFGQHLPANAVLSAVSCALLLALARQDKRTPQSPDAGSQSRRRVLNGAILAGALAVCLWALIGADNARVAEAHWRNVKDAANRLAEREWRGTPEEYEYLISEATAACDRQRCDAKYRYWLNVYRWHSIESAADPNIGQAGIPEESMPAVRSIVSGLHEARLLCATYGPVCSMVGQIEKFVLYNDGGAENIRRGFRLSPCDPISCLAAGYLDIAEGRNDDCVEKFERAVELDGTLFKPVVRIFVNRLSQPHLAISAAGDDIDRLHHVVGVLEEMQYRDLAEQTLEKITDKLEAKCSLADASAGEIALLGQIHTRQGNNEAAVECYRRALALDYGRVEWRLELAGLLARMERAPEAMREARICLRLRPGLKAAEELAGSLSVRLSAMDEQTTPP